MHATTGGCAHWPGAAYGSWRARSDISHVTRSKPTMPPPALAGDAPERRLRGRRRECETLDRLVANVRAGQSRVLVLRGEAGAGKTALLEYLLERASGMPHRASGGRGVRDGARVRWAASAVRAVPGPARAPARSRSATRSPRRSICGGPPGRSPEAAASLRRVAGGPGVGDAHGSSGPRRGATSWRSPGAERCAQYLAGLTELVVHGLTDGDRGRCWTRPSRVRSTSGCATGSWPRRGATRWRLLELARGLTPEELAGGFGLPGAPAPPGRIEESFRRRLAPLPEATRLLLLVAAAEPVRDPVLVWRAAGQLGIKVEAAAAAASAGLIESGGQVRFCHPLARSAVYRAASPEERQSAHRALAEAIDPDTDPDRRAWHRAHATPGLDEDVAAELERSAEPGPGPWRPGGGRRLLRARRRADARAGPPGPACAGRGAGQAPGRRARRRAAAAGHGAGRTAR